MAFDRQALVLRIQGHFGTLTTFSDGWSAGLRIASVTLGEPPTAGLGTFLTTIAPAVSTFHGSTFVKAGNACFLDKLTVARVGTDGKYDPDTQETTVYDYPTPVVGNATTIMPWSNALVCSLRTSRPRGYASNGRFYYPVTGMSVTNTTGRITQSEVTNYLSACKTMMDAINAAAASLTSGLMIHVMSSVGAGLAAPVNTIRADGRFDAQERRENQTKSVYSTAALA